MREIKFRGWNKKRMIEWESLLKCYGDGESDYDLHAIFSGDENIELMQYTGLKDKNGKEIYEGDIFPCLYAFDGCTDHVMHVEWNNERSGFFPRWDYAKCNQKGVTKTMYDLINLEIIGNIYENPELLK